ncbi:MAG: aspartate carbamoyltransferase regulatory subunit, partial [Candidatus Micrarchaeota archaeon]
PKKGVDMLKVEKIANGTVIDHITAGRGLRVLDILNIKSGYTGKVALVMNAPSDKMGTKDIVKIAGKHIDDNTADRIALVAPEASLNIVKEYEVVEKRNVKLRERLIGIIKCPNPKCITNHESMESDFRVDGDAVRCMYCERPFKPQEISV